MYCHFEAGLMLLLEVCLYFLYTLGSQEPVWCSFRKSVWYFRHITIRWLERGTTKTNKFAFTQPPVCRRLGRRRWRLRKWQQPPRRWPVVGRGSCQVTYGTTQPSKYMERLPLLKWISYEPASVGLNEIRLRCNHCRACSRCGCRLLEVISFRWIVSGFHVGFERKLYNTVPKNLTSTLQKPELVLENQRSIKTIMAKIQFASKATF